MKFSTSLISLIAALSVAASTNTDPICDSLGSIPIIRYGAPKTDGTPCEEGTGYCGNDGGHFECKNGKYVKGSCSCPGRMCVKKAMNIECEKIREPTPPVDSICDSLGSIPIIRYGTPKTDGTPCEEGTGYCANDGGHFECKNGKYVKGSCSCPGRMCVKKAMNIECEKTREPTPPVDPICDSFGSIPIIRYGAPKTDGTPCEEGTGYCANDGGHFECKNGKYVKGSCSCPGRMCVKKAMNIECEKIRGPATPVYPNPMPGKCKKH